MSVCPFSYDRGGYRSCQKNDCAIWHRESLSCALLAIANEVCKTRPTYCRTCNHYNCDNTCDMEAAVSSSNNMAKYCHYYSEKEG